MSFRRAALALLLFTVLLGGLAVGIHSLTQDNTLGIDYFVFWQAGRTTYLDHSSPYSLENDQRSQLAIIKRLAAPDENQMGFAYPPYALLPLFPVVLLPIDWSAAVWIAFLLLALSSAFLWAFPAGPRWVGPTFLFFYPVFFGLLLGNFAILVTALLLFLFGRYLPQNQPGPKWQIAAGIILAWLTIKPQFTWPFLVFFGLYGLRRRQWKFLAAAAASFAAFLALSFGLVPNWLTEWPASIARYIGYTQAWPISTFLLKEVLPLETAGWLTWVLAGLTLAISTGLIWRWWQNRLEHLPLVAWLALVGFWFHPHGTSYEHLAFLLPLAVWLCSRPRPRPAALAWWFSSLVVSWIAFAIARVIPAASEWPILFHLIWVISLFWSPNRVKILPKADTSAIIEKLKGA